jgi:hypothetical protein
MGGAVYCIGADAIVADARTGELVWSIACIASTSPDCGTSGWSVSIAPKRSV